MHPDTGHLVNLEESAKDFLKKNEGYEEVPENLRKLANQELAGKKEVYVDRRKKLVRDMKKLSNQRKTSRRKRGNRRNK